MPQGTRAAMLEAVENDSIIVGAYTDSDGGMCPMLAAHRNGGRTNLASFAHAWDRYTKAGSRARPPSASCARSRRCSRRASCSEDELDTSDFKQVIAEHRAAKARRPSRSRELFELEAGALGLVVARPKELDLGHDAVGGRLQ